MADIEKNNPTDLVALELLNDLRQIIDAARSHVAATANYELTMMYWHIGNRINTNGDYRVHGRPITEVGQVFEQYITIEQIGVDENNQIHRRVAGCTPDGGV